MIKFTDRIRNIIECRLDHFIEKIIKQEQELKKLFKEHFSQRDELIFSKVK